VLKAMAKSPNDRYQSAAEMQADIQRAASGMQVAAMAMPPMPTRADYYGYQDRTQRMGPQTMMGAAPTEVAPYQQTGYGGGYDGGDMEPRRSWARRWLPWLIPLLVVLAAVIAAVLLLHSNGKTYYVPQVNGEPRATALQQIRSEGLNPVVVDQNSSTVQTGYVINTSPGNGDAIGKGGTVTVYVSEGTANVLLPNVQGLQATVAQQKLSNDGFNNVVVKSDPQSTDPSGEVDHMTPNPGSKYSPDTQITLYVSGGGVQVPQVTGIPVASATQTLAGYNLTWKIEYAAGPAGTQPGYVWNQIPTQGTTEPKGYQVVLQVQPAASPSPSTTSPSPSTTSPSPTAPTTTPPTSPTATGTTTTPAP
jgi:eukaryotic-like serine/threonine-protein kinase